MRPAAAGQRARGASRLAAAAARDPLLLSCPPRCQPQLPLDQAQFDLRAREYEALRAWVAAPAAAVRADGRPILTPEYMQRVVPQ